MAITDEDGDIVNAYEYDAWGIFTATCPSQATGKPCIPNRYTYTGREWDADLQMYYYRARWYDPTIQRFTSEDPILHLNAYLYVENRPISYKDPYGFWEYANEYHTNGDGLTDDMRNTEDTVDRVYNDITGHDAVVTYTTNGGHSDNSLHYSGNAVDLRTRGMTSEQKADVTQSLSDELGDDYDVVNEGNHIHVEYDPENPEANNNDNREYAHQAATPLEPVCADFGN